MLNKKTLILALTLTWTSVSFCANDSTNIQPPQTKALHKITHIFTTEPQPYPTDMLWIGLGSLPDIYFWPDTTGWTCTTASTKSVSMDSSYCACYKVKFSNTAGNWGEYATNLREGVVPLMTYILGNNTPGVYCTGNIADYQMAAIAQKQNHYDSAFPSYTQAGGADTHPPHPVNCQCLQFDCSAKIVKIGRDWSELPNVPPYNAGDKVTAPYRLSCYKWVPV